MTTVTELHLGGSGTRCSGQKLMTQADTENRGLILLHDGGDVGNGSLENSGVTGSVGKEKAVVFVAGGSDQIMVPWAYEDLNSALQEAAKLVIFHTDIDTQDTDGATGRVLARGNRCRGLVELGSLDGNYETMA